MRTTASWLRSSDHVATLTGLDRSSRLWLPGPLAATMNLFAAVLARTVGAAVVEAPDGATHAHLTPLALAGALDRVAGLHVTVAGARLSPGQHDRAVAAGATVAHYYGASELSFVAWGPHAEALRPFPEVLVEVRDGELWARSPYLCEGYAGAPGPLRRDARGFATVGDRGALRDGVLTVTGRGADAVTTGAATVLVADVEAVLATAVSGEVVVLGVPHEELGEVVAAVLTDPDDRVAARQAAVERLDPAQRPRVWFHVPTLPVGAAGKVDRAALAGIVAAPSTRRLVATGPVGP
ncbi:AMP-binding protein [Nocardioides caldifontis]|uniref:AMP-binding protein n=1 Tax=Nocardioides caldifontis TaxID=2588938 RepID=UPI0011E039F8